MRHDKFVFIKGFVDIIFKAGWNLRRPNDGDFDWGSRDPSMDANEDGAAVIDAVTK